MKIYFFSSTHWDREWYMPFQGFRMRLVGMVDRLIDTLENDKDFGVFHFDGQTVVLEDYLEIYPENRGRLEKLIKSGKLVVGPWYVMPDELLLSGESYIKNLQKGFKISRQFGAEPMKLGYLCDMFGHCAQMPQILKEMGINNAVVGRGANDHTTPMHFGWDAPSGDGIVSYKLQDSAGYSAIQVKVFRPLIGTEYTREQVAENIKNYVDFEIERANVPIVLLMDGDDHQDCRRDTVECLKIIRELYPDAEICQDNISEFMNDINAYEKELPHRCGELVEPTKQVTDYSNLLTNCLSSRYPIKRKNDVMQSTLEQVVEPLYALGQIKESYRFIDIANTYLLKNHAHDSICGCSLDVVHRDMMTRFEQSEAICDQLISEFWHSRRSHTKSDELYFEILNPLPYDDKRTVEAEIFFPLDWKTKYAEYFQYEWLNGFYICDESGKEIPYGIVSVKKNSCRRYHNLCFDDFDVYTVSFEADLRAMAANRFTVKPSKTPQRYLDYIKADEYSAENDYLAISFDAFGGLNILDKGTGKHYEGLLRTVDDGEIGDGWNHGGFANDFAVSNTLHSIRRTEHNYSRVTFVVEQKLDVPAGVLRTEQGIIRTESKTTLTVTHTVSLGRNARYVEVKTTVNNNAKNHRLRLKMPTALSGDNYFVNQPFCFVERKRGVDVSTQDWKEKSILEKQTAGIVALKNQQNSFAFIADHGLHECGVSRDGDIYITLLRAFSRVHLIDEQFDSQLQGVHEYRYILAVGNSDISLAELQRRQDILKTDGIVANVIGGDIPVMPSAIKITGENIVYSTLVSRDGKKELRIYNASDSAADAKIDFAVPISDAKLVDFDGKVKKELAGGSSVSLKLNKWEIVTIQYK